MLPNIDFAKAHHVLQLKEYLSQADESIRRASIVGVSAYKITSTDDALFSKSLGKASHQFLVVEVMSEGESFYAAIHFGPDPFESYPVSQTVVFSNDLETMCRGCTHFCHMRSIGNAFSFEQFASLLSVVYERSGNYVVFSRNCYWLTSVLLLSITRRYSHHWLQGDIEPQCLREYANGQRDEISIISEIILPGEENGFLRRVVQTSLLGLKGLQVWISGFGSQETKVRPYSEEISEILENW